MVRKFTEVLLVLLFSAFFAIVALTAAVGTAQAQTGAIAVGDWRVGGVGLPFTGVITPIEEDGQRVVYFNLGDGLVGRSQFDTSDAVTAVNVFIPPIKRTLSFTVLSRMMVRRVVHTGYYTDEEVPVAAEKISGGTIYRVRFASGDMTARIAIRNDRTQATIKLERIPR